MDSFIAKLETAILNPLVTLLGILAFLYFVYGVVMFIRNADNDEKRKEGQRHMIYGIIGLVIIFGANAIIALIAGSLNVPLP